MSPRLSTLRKQNSDLLKKQHQLEEQLAQQQQQQQQLIERLVQKGLLQSQDEETNSLLQETQSKWACVCREDVSLRRPTNTVMNVRLCTIVWLCSIFCAVLILSQLTEQLYVVILFVSLTPA